MLSFSEVYELLETFNRLRQQPESESYVTTDGQPASQSWHKAPFWGLRPDLYYCLTVAGLLIWGALSDERTGLSFAIATGPRQRSYFQGRVLWNLRPYFTVSDLRLPFSLPPSTHRVTVEVFDPASTRGYSNLPKSYSLYSLGADAIQNTVSNSSLLCRYVFVVAETFIGRSLAAALFWHHCSGLSAVMPQYFDVHMRSKVG
jgi:hypothetical protein